MLKELRDVLSLFTVAGFLIWCFVKASKARKELTNVTIIHKCMDNIVIVKEGKDTIPYKLDSTKYKLKKEGDTINVNHIQRGVSNIQ